jgi:hypothetical protein
VRVAAPEDELRDVVSRYWVVDDITHPRVHGNIPEGFGSFAVELRHEPKGSQVDSSLAAVCAPEVMHNQIRRVILKR